MKNVLFLIVAYLALVQAGYFQSKNHALVASLVMVFNR